MLGMVNPSICQLSLLLGVDHSLLGFLFPLINELLLTLVPSDEGAILLLRKKIIVAVLMLMPHVQHLLVVMVHDHIRVGAIMKRGLLEIKFVLLTLGTIEDAWSSLSAHT